jgi:hypothetical protein
MGGGHQKIESIIFCLKEFYLLTNIGRHDFVDMFNLNNWTPKAVSGLLRTKVYIGAIYNACLNNVLYHGIRWATFSLPYLCIR